MAGPSVPPLTETKIGGICQLILGQINLGKWGESFYQFPSGPGYYPEDGACQGMESWPWDGGAKNS